MFCLEKKCLERGDLEIAQHEVPSGFLEGVAHCTFLIYEHQASSGGVVEVLSLLSYYSLGSNKFVCSIQPMM